jgi:hypothetical protein
VFGDKPWNGESTWRPSHIAALIWTHDRTVLNDLEPKPVTRRRPRFFAFPRRGQRNVATQLVRGWSGTRADSWRTSPEGYFMAADSGCGLWVPRWAKLSPGTQLEALEEPKFLRAV